MMQKKILAVAACLAVLLGFGVRASAQQGASQQPAELKASNPAEELIQKQKAIPVVAYWKNAFTLSTPDEAYWLKIRGNVHLDSRFYGANSANPSNFDIRRARIDLQGQFYKFIQMRLQAEFADNPYIRNAYVDFAFRDWLHLRPGQMKPPFSTSWWTLDNNVNFIERGAGTPIYPFFDRGFWIWGDLFEKSVTYNLSVWTGAGMDLDYQRGDIDDHKDFIGRLFLAPFITLKDYSFLQNTYVCVEGSYGMQSIPTTRFETKGYRAAVYDDLYWTWETQNPGYGEIGGRNRWGAEFHYIYGPFSVSTEYLVAEYKDIDVFDKKDGALVIPNAYGKVKSWSTWVSFFLTGESKTLSNEGWRQPNPRNDFDPFHFKGLGAWEVLVRYTHTKTDEDLFQTTSFGGKDYRILAGADDVYEYTAGVNWTWNALVRWQFNYVHLDATGEGIQTGDKNYKEGIKKVKNEDQYAFRMIFRF